MTPQDSKVPNCDLVFCDALQYLKKRLTKPRLRPVSLAVCDPPYNYGQKYAGYSDNLSRQKFLDWTHGWLRVVSDTLEEAEGSMWVFVPDEWVSYVDIFCRDTLGLTRRNWIVWAFTFGQRATKSFTRSKCHVLYFVKDPDNFTFNANEVGVPSARQLVYKDKRAAGLKPPDDVWMLLGSQLEPYMTPDRDVWLESRICGSFKERQPHSPNQIPLPLVERIVLACSKPGDLVLSPFLGSGTDGVAALKHGRRFLGLDVSAECVAKSRERILKEVGDGR